MADAGLKFDFSEAIDRLGGLAAAAKNHLPRSMCVAAGEVFRDEAKARAPVYDGGTALLGGANVKRPPVPGLLRDAIYLAFADRRSQLEAGRAVYSVAWNANKAPHGHLLEFGHWRYNQIRGSYPKTERLPAPKWVPASPFLRPTFDAVGQLAVAAGLARGQQRMTEILANPDLLGEYS